MPLPSTSLRDQKTLIALLCQALRCSGVDPLCIETHISWVIVAGEFAFKLKKPVKFDFLDFTSLKARRFYCEEELRLNRRFGRGLYLGISVITGSLEHPEIDGTGAPVEYAVKMRAFPQEALWSHKVEDDSLTEAEIDELAANLAAFHARAERAPAAKPWGSPLLIKNINVDSLAAIAGQLPSLKDKESIRYLVEWNEYSCAELTTIFEKRKEEGFVRECHGDLHCGNVLTFHGHPLAFDCIEFNDDLRWIDVLNDLAFLVMDLRFHGLAGMAARLLNRYLEETGDYEHLAALRFYETSRALVRCRVACLQAADSNPAPAAASLHKARAYLAFAAGSVQPAARRVIITHGLSGSGKSTLARMLVEIIGAVQIRSDVERKRLHGLAALEDGSANAAIVYSTSATRSTFERLEMLAACIVNAGLPVVVDAAFLRREERQRFAHLAREWNAAFHIFDLRADGETMRARLIKRKQLGGDASDADVSVLERQMAFHEELTPDEMAYVIPVDSAICADRQKIAELLKQKHWELA